MINNSNFERAHPIHYGTRENVFLIFECFVLVLVSISVVWIALLRAGSPIFDEFYHLLAARSWAADGSLAIGDGVYDRAWLFTKAVGVVFSAFGESIQTARIVPAAGAVAWLLLVFLWVHFFMGRAVAWVTVFLLLFSTEFLSLAVFVRFYTWHGFFVFLGFSLITLALYTSAPRIYRFAAGFFAVVSLAVAFHLQPTTMIAILGILTWLALAHLSLIVSIIQFIARRPGLLLLTIFTAAIALTGVFAMGIPQSLWRMYTQTALWNIDAGIMTYHWFFAARYTVLWAIFPFIAILAAVYRPPFGLSCAVIFSVAFLLHSFGGMRSVHYLLYAFPFFCIVCAISIVLAAQWLYREICNFDRIFLHQGLSNLRLSAMVWLFILMLTGPLFITYNSGIDDAFVIIAGGDETFREGNDWSAFSAELNRIADEVEVVVVTYGVAGLYYLGDIDYVLSQTIMLETDTREEFGLDRRIGRHVISSAESLQKIMEQHASGMIVVDKLRWGNPSLGTNAEVIKLIELYMQPVTGLNTDDAMAFTWRHKQDQGIGFSTQTRF